MAIKVNEAPGTGPPSHARVRPQRVVGVGFPWAARARQQAAAQARAAALLAEARLARARFETSTAQAREHLGTLLEALDIAATAKRDATSICDECEDKSCGTCAWRQDRAAAFEALASQLQGGAQ